MIRTKDVLNCLPLLASILGDRYGVQVRIGGKEACTNGKVIHLPSLRMDCEPELLALARSFVDHESGHIRHTDFSVLKAANLDPVTFNLFNCLEDWRVEKKLSGIFPGCRKNLNWLIQRFFVEQVQSRAGGDSPALTVLDYVLLTVRAWDVDEVTPARQNAASIIEQHFPSLKEALDAILVKVYIHCPDTTAAVEYARQIAQCIRQWEPPQPMATRKCTDKNDHDMPLPTKEETDSASKIDQQAETIQPLRALSALPLKALFHAEAQDLPQQIGEIMAIELANSSVESASDALTVAVEGTRHAAPLSAEQKLQALQASIALRTRLQGFLQAQTQRRCSIGRRGALHANSLHRLQVGNARVFQKESVQLGLNTAVHILLDVSGSMGGCKMDLASRACYTVAMALEQCRGVNVGVTAFPAIESNNETTVAPLVRHGERVHTKFALSAVGYTPLAESLWWVMQQMLPLKEERKIILILSDGMPDSVTATKYALNNAKTLGFEVMGLGIQDNNLDVLLPPLGMQSRTIHNLPDLTPAMFGMLQEALLGRGVRA